jgi:hypothetical protein
MRWLDVSTNLLQCVDEGRSAFDVAHGSMNKIWDMVLMMDKTVGLLPVPFDFPFADYHR